MSERQNSALREVIDRVKAAAAAGTPLYVHGGRTKDFYGETPQGEPLSMLGVKGVSSYEPSELVVTVRAGTSLAALEATLAESGQCLPFEPPHFGAASTVGGMVAAGLSGPSRAAVGSVRDYVLGVTLLNGNGELLSFGGQVMKNVAGYDVSRLMAGSLGVLGILVEVSLKVLPAPVAMATLRFDRKQKEALVDLNKWAAQPLPIDASVWWDDTLAVRLRGAQAAVNSAIARLGGELVDPAFAKEFWAGLRDHRDEFFAKARTAVDAGATLWRLSVPSTTAPIAISGEQLIEWGGAQRWVCTTAPHDSIREAARAAGGHSTLFRGTDRSPGVFTPLAAPLDRIHRELKRSFDPAGIFNRGRMYPDF